MKIQFFDWAKIKVGSLSRWVIFDLFNKCFAKASEFISPYKITDRQKSPILLPFKHKQLRDFIPHNFLEISIFVES